MKKVLSVLAIVMLASCGSATTVPNVSNDTVSKKDTIKDTRTIDTSNQLKQTYNK